MRRLAIAMAVSIAMGAMDATPARAQPGSGSTSGDVSGDLEAAQAALSAAEYERAAEITGAIIRGGISRSDLTEAWRIRGLALFYLGRRAQSEQALLEFLKLDPDVIVDPALVPPELIAFIQDIRTRYATELDKYRPKPKRNRYWWLNLVPVAGQIQNGDTTKAWILGSSEGVLLAANVTTFVLLRSWCAADNVCEKDSGENRGNAARAARAINTASGAVLIGVTAYGVIDAFVGHRRISRRESESSRETMSVGVFPTNDGAFVGVGGQF